MRLRLAWLMIVCLSLVAAALAQGPLDSGLIADTAKAWSDNFGHVVNGTFQPTQNFQLGLGEFSGEEMASYGAGVGGSGHMLADGFDFAGPSAYDLDKLMASNLNPTASSGSTYRLNLGNAVPGNGAPISWEGNAGADCQSSGCPSSAFESAVDETPAEVFTTNSPSPIPEPSSILLFGAGILAVAVVLRRHKRP